MVLNKEFDASLKIDNFLIYLSTEFHNAAPAILVLTM